jgi:hypothetical protein
MKVVDVEENCAAAIEWNDPGWICAPGLTVEPRAAASCASSLLVPAFICSKN